MLALSKVSIQVEDKQIAQNIDVAIEPGTVHALMGPNGSGKSSLSLALAGHPNYHLRTNSSVKLDGKDLIETLPEERAKLGLFLTFQNPLAIPGLTVKQLIKLITDHVRPEKVGVKELLAEMKEHVDLLHIKPELLNRSVNDNFSGGEKKRIEMLQLLMARPKYAIIDEIDSGLDIDAIKLMGTAINQAKNDFHTGFLLITHYRRILHYVKPDKVHVLIQGKALHSGGYELLDEIEQEGFGKWV